MKNKNSKTVHRIMSQSVKMGDIRRINIFINSILKNIL